MQQPHPGEWEWAGAPPLTRVSPWAAKVENSLCICLLPQCGQTGSVFPEMRSSERSSQDSQVYSYSGMIA